MEQHFQHWLRVGLPCLFAAFPWLPAQAQITPNGLGTQVNQQGQQFNIIGGTQAGRNLFHSFSQFGLNQGQVANFFSNPAIANILARVNGGSASYINGLIQVLGGKSNLFLMNPSGIVFGPNASLNVPAAFTATTADRILFPGGSFNAYSNNDISKLVGEPIGFAFDRKDPAAIVNEGKLAVNPGQSISLIAGQVINTGTVQAPGGNITITAVPGENLVRLSQAGQLLSLEFNPQQAAQYADSAGNIPIIRLPELLTGGGVTTVTQNSNGTVSVAGANLQIPTATGTAIISGTLDVSSSNQTGGNVGVFGTNIALVNTTINASGFTGGGEILVGGEFQGKGTQPNAQYTFVNSNSKLLADAINAGDGGRVIVWADKTTQFFGTISAQGGELSGNGGFVEVSGKENLAFQGKVDTSAPQGKAGTLLLDPTNITINLSGPDDPQIADGQILFGDGGASDFTISVGALISALNSGNVILQATNDITLQVTLNYNGIGATRDLTFQANNNIFLNAGIFDSAPGGEQLNMNFQANADGIGGGNVAINSPVIKTEGANFFASGVDINVNGTIETFSTTGNSGNITLSGTGTVETLGGVILDASAAGNKNAGNISISGKTGVIIGDLVFSGVVGIGTGNAGSISLTSTNGNIITTSLNSQTQGTGTGGEISLSGLGIITTGGTIASDSTGGGTGGKISLIATQNGINIPATQILSGGGNITINGKSNSGTGVLIQDNSVINSGTGVIKITGFTDANIDFSYGVLVTINSEITSLDSLIRIIGTNDATGGDNQSGVRFDTGGKITGLGTTNISIDGDSSLSSFSTSGVFLDTVGTVIFADQGDISITGGGRNTDPSTSAIFVNGGSDIVGGKLVELLGNGVQPNGGNITVLGSINGSQVFANGVGVTTVNQITAPGGDIFIGGELGVFLVAGSTVSTNAVGFDSGNLTIESSAGAVTISPSSTVSTEAVGNDNAGKITITAANGFTSNSLISSSVTGGLSGNAGSVDITVSGTGDLIVNSDIFTTTDGTGKGGVINLISGGKIQTSGFTISSASTGGGDGGNITFNAGGNIISGDIFSTGEAGGNISLISSTGDIDLSTAPFGISTAGPTNGSGNVTLNANADITAPNIFTGSIDSLGGNITVKSTNGVVNIAGEINSSSGSSRGGDVSVNAKGSVEAVGGLQTFGANGGGNVTVKSNTDSIFIDNLNLNTTGGSEAGGNVNLQAATTIDVPFGIETISSLQGGNITLKAGDDITIGNGGIGLRSFGTLGGNAGAIQITSTSGNLIVNANSGEGIFANALDGSGNTVSINVANDINVTGQISSGSFNGVAQNTTIIAGGDVNVTGKVQATSNTPGGAGLLTITGDAVTLGGWGTGDGGGIKITTNTLTTGASNSGSSAVFLTVGDVNFLGTIDGVGSLGKGTVTITAPSGGVFVNDTGAGLNLTTADLSQLTGFKTLTLGSGSIPLTVGTSGITFDTSTNLVGSTVNVQGNVTTPESLTLSAKNNLIINGDLTATSIALNSGGSSSISGNLNSTGGAITFNTAGAINLTQNLILNDNTTIQGGSINANGFNILNTTFDTILNSQGMIKVNDITTTGGAVKISSSSNIFANNITTQGGAISLTSGDVVNVGDLISASTTGNGGSITIIATNAVTTQIIDSSSKTGIGGNVFIDPIGDVQVKYINTQGGIQGGSVDIKAGRYFRATGTFIDNGGVTASISTRGGSGGGIKITHGGKGIVPFIVGDASVNGTAGAITTGAFTILPFEEFLTSFTLGNIEIFTLGGGSDSSFVNNILFSLEFGDSPLDIELGEGDEILDTDAIDTAEIADRLAAGDIEAVAVLDQLFSDQFADFYGVQPLNNFRTVAEVQNALADIAAKTGTRPALLYILGDERQLSLVLIPPGRGQGVADIPILEVALNNLQSEAQLLTQTPGAQPVYRAIPEAKAEVLAKTVSQFLNGIKDPRQRNNENYKQPAQQLYQWLIAPIEAALQENKIDTIMLVPDVGLRTLPYGALFDGRQFLIERYSIGQIPSINLVDMNYQRLKGSTVLAMGASEFKQQQPLPAVPIELQTIAQEWGGKVFLNQQFTINNLVQERQRTQFQMLHLATHGEFRPSRLTDSYIEFWDDRLLLNQLQQLPLRQPPVELMVLSACRTAVGDKNTELGFAGLAVGAGVKSVVASSWYVSDEGTLALMSEFYQQLQTAPIKALALRQAQMAMIRGDVRLQNNQLIRPNRPPIKMDVNIGDRQLNHPYYWAAFTLIGSPW